MMSRYFSSPWIICLTIVFIVAVSDSSIMFLIDHLELQILEKHENIFEPIGMGLFSLPLIYFFIVNPFLAREERNKKRILEEKRTKLTILATQAEALEMAVFEATKGLKESEARYALVAEGVNDGIWEWNLEKESVYFSNRWKFILGYDEAFQIESMSWWYDQMNPDDRKLMQDQIASLSPENRTFSIQYQIKNAQNMYIWVLTRGISVFDDKGALIRIAGSQTDITQQKETEDHLYYNAYYDQLTGIPNRRLFQDRLTQFILRAERHSDQSFALAFLDLDNFKKVNDSFGHATGDAFLKKISAGLVQTLRKSDNIARLGGDEFAIILEDAQTLEEIQVVAQKILKTVNSPFVLDGREFFPSTSIGVVMWEKQYRTIDYLVRDADFALYRAKLEGKNCIAIFDEEMRLQSVNLFHKENQLHQALDKKELHVFYQPIVESQSFRLVGFEALMRWHHPEFGWVSPIEFIKIAEDSHLILEMGDFILEESMKQFSLWLQKYDFMEFMSVNISARQLEDPKFVDRIMIYLEKYNLSPHYLKLEVTETAVMKNPDLARLMLRSLSDEGIQIAIDDFGTGYSSLGMLHSFDFDFLKVDQCFIKEIAHKQEVYDMVESIHDMSENLSLKTIVEGVEDADQAKILQKIGANYLQGFYFGKPISAEETEQYVMSLSYDKISA